MILPGARVLNRHLTEHTGSEVVLIEALPVVAGQPVSVRFEGGRSEWRQGIWLATDGELRVEDAAAPQLVLWRDTSPRETEISVVATDGWLRLYNIWDSGRGLGPFESQRHTSGMLVTRHGEWLRYDCADIGADPGFDRLTFLLRLGAA